MRRKIKVKKKKRKSINIIAINARIKEIKAQISNLRQYQKKKSVILILLQ
jgi:hypothetical protein